MPDHRPNMAAAPTSWLLVQIDPGETDLESIEHALLNLGAVSIQYSDVGDEPILEPDPGTTPLWRKVRIGALFNADTGETDVRLAIAGSITAQMPPVSFSIVEDRDWVSEWKQNLNPVIFGGRLWVCPPDTPCPDAGGVAVTMEPGLAFGTGSHPTTGLCLDWLAHQPLENWSILDFGCGSGILGIAALTLGADRVTAIDIDDQALMATRENSRRNECLDRMRIGTPDLCDDREAFDLIVANILSGTLIGLEPTLRSHSLPGTRIALSGILTSQVEEVSSAYRRWASFDPAVTRGEWAILAGRAI